MAEAGRGASTRLGTKDELSSNEGGYGDQCDQCKEDDLIVDADGYCEDCGDNLCANCIQQHRRLRASKDHTVLTGSDLPDQKPRKPGGNKCSNHPGKSIELYCPSDGAFGCVLCFVLDHKSCKKVGLISELSKDIESSQELRDFQTAGQQHETSVEFYRKLIEEYHVINNACYDKSVEDFESFRAEIETLVDRLGEAVKSDASNFKEINKTKLDYVSDRVTSLDTALEAILSTIKLKGEMKQLDQLFIAVMTNMKLMRDQMKKLQQLYKEIQIQKYVFEEKPSIKQGLETMINSCMKKALPVNTTYIGEMNVRSHYDKKVCGISGIVIVPPSKIVVSDSVNQCLKMADIVQSTAITKRSLRSPPSDVTVIPESRVAVAVPDLKQLQLFTAETNLKPCGHIAVDGQCISVESTGDRLVVGYSQPPKVQIMELSGQVLKSFTTDSSGNPLFGVPRGLCLSPDHTSIFISDWKNDTVTRMSTDGTIEWVYQDEDLKYPLGMATGSDGCLYICSRDTHSLHAVSGKGRKHVIIPVDKFQLKYPWAICNNMDQNVMYVSNVMNDPDQRNLVRRFAIQ